MNPQVTPDTMSSSHGAPEAVDSTEDRLELILRLQRQAIYPLGQVAGVWAQSQLAHVEVPWPIGSLQDALAWTRQLKNSPWLPANGAGLAKATRTSGRRDDIFVGWPCVPLRISGAWRHGPGKRG